MTHLTRFGAALLVFLVAAPAYATSYRSLEMPLRGKTITLAVYYPTKTPIGTILMGSGDVGWVGLATNMADLLSDRGYLVIGLNVRQYLTVFRTGRAHLTVDEAPEDFRAIAEFLRTQELFFAPVTVSGVSEGAALAILAAADPHNHSWISGIITMGVPATAELAWKWTDFTSWITKKDANEPSFSPYDFVASVAPLPIVMLQSRKDEYVPESDYQRCHENARDPKKLVVIDASNHRFTDRRPELQREYLAALEWLQANQAAQHAPAPDQNR